MQPSTTGERVRLDDALSVRDDGLWFEERSLRQIAEEFGTPLYVVSEDQLRRNYRRFRSAFQQAWPEGPIRILPSIKANYALALRAILTEEGAGCDTFGMGEWYAARQSGVNPELISVNGASKDDELLRNAICAGARITLDSVEELERVRSLAESLSTRAKVRFRLRPDYRALVAPSDFSAEGESIRELATRYKPGIPSADLVARGAEAIRDRSLDVTGVMVHLGRHSADLAVWAEMARSTAQLIGRFSKAWGGWEPREIDLGGGFAAPRDPTGRLMARGREREPRVQAPHIEEYAATLSQALREGLRAEGIDTRGRTLEVEPGRSLFADAGVHLTRVRHLKSEDGDSPRRWVETDTTEMFLLDSLLEHNRWTVLAVDAPLEQGTALLDVVGISCGFDIIVPDAQLPLLNVGDVLAFLDTGAYQDACASNFNALPRPGTVLIAGREASWIRHPETVEDVFRRDRVPARLHRTAANGVP